MFAPLYREQVRGFVRLLSGSKRHAVPIFPRAAPPWWRLTRLRFCCGWTMEKLGAWQCPFLCCAYEQRARCLRRLMRTGARVCTLTLLSRVGGEDLSGDMCALSSRVNGAWYSRRFTANRCAVIHIPLPCAQMACDIRVFANGYDGCAFLNCGLVRGIQISHPFSVFAGAIAFL